MTPDPELFDAAGGIGHSPAATAAWLRAAEGRPDLEHAVARGREYLVNAANATRTGIPGVVPTAWPINRFERSFGPFALHLAGLFNHPALADQVAAHAADAMANLRPQGFSFSDAFTTSGDDTAAGVILVHLAGYKISPALLRGYERDGHFCTFPRELQISYSALARATYALNLLGEDSTSYVEDLMAIRRHDGRWAGDKWNSSWLYTTCHAVNALVDRSDAAELLAPTVRALVAHQYPDGGWGSFGGSNPTETAYAVLTLRRLSSIPAFERMVRPALARAKKQLFASYRPLYTGTTTCWIGKEIYRPYRVDRTFELSATLALALEEE